MSLPWKRTSSDKAMFTGIVEEVGTIRELGGSHIRVNCEKVLVDTLDGSSIAVNGVCLTARRLQPDSFAADLAPETLKRTNLGDLRPGHAVNLERALLPTTRLSGHVVQGHIDGTGDFLALDQTADDAWWLSIRIPPELERYVVFKGSICIDGISLTVASIEFGIVSVAIIPHTYEQTAMRDKRPGDRLNLETDVLAKYVEKMLVR